MIPKIIHYCWFGRNPLPPSAMKCIESWRKIMPDYEIKEWNEDNFNINIIPYTQEAYQAKKYAFVSDYARFWILYNYGGVYFDTDVELIKPIYDIVEKGAFWGCEGSLYKESEISISPGVGIGVRAHHPIYKELLECYEKLHFINVDKSYNYLTIGDYTTQLLQKYGWKRLNQIQQVKDMYIYPLDYFCPIDTTTQRLKKTTNTRSIHWYAGSWKEYERFAFIKKTLKKIIPQKLQIIYNKLKNR